MPPRRGSPAAAAVVASADELARISAACVATAAAAAAAAADGDDAEPALAPHTLRAETERLAQLQQRLLDAVVASKALSVLVSLLAAGTSPTFALGGVSPLGRAIAAGDAERATALIAPADVPRHLPQVPIDWDASEADGNTPLVAAIHAGMPAVVTALLEVGASVGAYGAGGLPPLHAALEAGGNADIVRALLGQRGIDVGQLSADGRPPAMVAVQRGNRKAFWAILAVAGWGSDGMTAAEVAARCNLAVLDRGGSSIVHHAIGGSASGVLPDSAVTILAGGAAPEPDDGRDGHHDGDKVSGRRSGGKGGRDRRGADNGGAGGDGAAPARGGGKAKAATTAAAAAAGGGGAGSRLSPTASDHAVAAGPATAPTATLATSALDWSPEIALLIRTFGVSPDAHNAAGDTPLGHAAFTLDESAITALLTAGARADVATRYRPAPHIVASPALLAVWRAVALPTAVSIERRMATVALLVTLHADAGAIARRVALPRSFRNADEEADALRARRVRRAMPSLSKEPPAFTVAQAVLKHAMES